MKALTKRERMARAFRSQEVDRFPVSPRIWAWLAGEARSGKRLRTDLDLAERFRLHHVVRRTTCGLRAPFRDVFEEFRDVPGITASVRVVEEGRVRKVRRRIKTPAGELTELVIVPPPGGVRHLARSGEGRAAGEDGGRHSCGALHRRDARHSRSRPVFPGAGGDRR